MLELGEVFTLGEECAGLSTGWSVVHELLPQSHFLFLPAKLMHSCWHCQKQTSNSLMHPSMISNTQLWL